MFDGYYCFRTIIVLFEIMPPLDWNSSCSPTLCLIRKIPSIVLSIIPTMLIVIPIILSIQVLARIVDSFDFLRELLLLL